MKCNKCKKMIEEKNLIHRNGYKLKTCRMCINKANKERQRKKAKMLKYVRSYYS